MNFWKLLLEDTQQTCHLQAVLWFTHALPAVCNLRNKQLQALISVQAQWFAPRCQRSLLPYRNLGVFLSVPLISGACGAPKGTSENPFLLWSIKLCSALFESCHWPWNFMFQWGKVLWNSSSHRGRDTERKTLGHQQWECSCSESTCSSSFLLKDFQSAAGVSWKPAGFYSCICNLFLLVQPVLSSSHLYLPLNPALYDFTFFSLAISLLFFWIPSSLSVCACYWTNQNWAERSGCCFLRVL